MECDVVRDKSCNLLRRTFSTYFGQEIRIVYEVSKTI